MVGRPAVETRCTFRIEVIEDRRDDKSLGRLARTRVDGEGFIDWFAHGMSSIPGHTDGAAARTLKVEVLKGYIQSIGVMKSANLVVRVVTTDPTGQRVVMFRGVHNSTNWNSSENEVQAAFDLALADLQQQMGTDLQKHCGS